jgi:hypothetical protein
MDRVFHLFALLLLLPIVAPGRAELVENAKHIVTKGLRAQALSHAGHEPAPGELTCSATPCRHPGRRSTDAAAVTAEHQNLTRVRI